MVSSLTFINCNKIIIVIFENNYDLLFCFFYSCRQLILLLDLYSPRDIYDYLRPIALNLCADKVSSVRWISYKLV